MVYGQNATVRDIVEAAEEMKSTILDSLLGDVRFSSIRHLFTAIDEVLQLGLVWNVLDLYHYMVMAATVRIYLTLSLYLHRQK